MARSRLSRRLRFAAEGLENGLLTMDDPPEKLAVDLRRAAGERAKRVVEAVTQRLWTPLGLRSLDPGYAARYERGVRERDSVYPQGTVWSWLIGPFVEAWVRVHGESDNAKREARARFLMPLMEHLNNAGLGHISEIPDADPPHMPRGCPFQAWSVGRGTAFGSDDSGSP
jgi:glycogen debranching enzyme